MPRAADGQIAGKGGPLIGGGAVEINASASAHPHQASQFGEIFQGIAAIVVVAGKREIRDRGLIPGLGGNVVSMHDLLTGEWPMIKSSCGLIDGGMVIAMHDDAPGRLC